MRRVPALGRGLVVMVLAFLTTGCQLGPGRYEMANRPNGVTLELELLTATREGKAKLTGELLTILDEEVVVLAHELKVKERGEPERKAGRVVILRIPYSAIRRAKTNQFEDLAFGDGQAPPPNKRERLRRISRFPQGISSRLEQTLLSHHRLDRIQIWPIAIAAQ